MATREERRKIQRQKDRLAREIAKQESVDKLGVSNNGKRDLWLGITCGGGLTCVVALLAAPSTEWGIVSLVVIGGASFTTACFLHGWLSAFSWKIRIFRLAVFQVIIWGVMVGVGNVVWPRVGIAPKRLRFSQSGLSGETYMLRITNDKSSDVYEVTAALTFIPAVPREYSFDIPRGSLHELVGGAILNGRKQADVTSRICSDDSAADIYVYHLRPHESRNVIVRHLRNRNGTVTARISAFKSDQVAIHTEQNQVGTPIIAASQCKAFSYNTYVMPLSDGFQ